MIRGDRIRDLLRDGNQSQADLARAIGVSPQAISKMIKGGTTETAKIYQIARFLGTTPEFIEGETNDPTLVPSVGLPSAAPPERDPDDVEIDSIDLAFGMGGTFLDSDAVEVEKLRFSRKWLRQFTSAPPSMLCTTRGMGDSMMPTIHDQDVVIIDRSQRTWVGGMADKIWAGVFGGVGVIKRLRPMPDGSVKISSDNQLVRDEIAADGDLFIVGRVVAIVKSV